MAFGPCPLHGLIGFQHACPHLALRYRAHLPLPPRCRVNAVYLDTLAFTVDICPACAAAQGYSPPEVTLSDDDAIDTAAALCPNSDVLCPHCLDAAYATQDSPPNLNR